MLSPLVPVSLYYIRDVQMGGQIGRLKRFRNTRVYVYTKGSNQAKGARRAAAMYRRTKAGAADARSAVCVPGPDCVGWGSRRPASDDRRLGSRCREARDEEMRIGVAGAHPARVSVGQHHQILSRAHTHTHTNTRTNTRTHTHTHTHTRTRAHTPHR